jgi:hypothetical protein
VLEFALPKEKESWMNRAAFGLVGGLSVVLLAACTGSTATTAPQPTLAPTSVPSVAPTPASSSAPSAAAPSAEPTGVPTSLDPCQLVTASEASDLSGASFPAGTEGTTQGGGKTCVYGAQTSNVFTVIVAVAPDVATAKAGEAEAEAQIAKAAGKGVKPTELPNFADGAVYYAGDLKIGSATYHVGAIYVLSGTTFFGFSDLNSGGLVLTGTGLQAQAQAILSRLP